MATEAAQERSGAAPAAAAPGVSIVSGTRDVCGQSLPYDLYLPAAPPASPGAASPPPCPGGVLLLHGFGADRSSLAGHARRLAASGVPACTPNLSSLTQVR